MHADTTVTALFTQNEYVLTITQATGGTISAAPASPYHYGDDVTLTATADPGYTFTGWTGDASGTTSPFVLDMNGDKTVSATFELNVVTLTITQATGGTISAAPASPYHYGDDVTLTATADPGYTFTGWTGDASGTTSPFVLDMNGDKTVSATFELNVVTLTITQATGGTISAAPASPYHYGDDVTLTATADPGYTFTGWTGDASGTTNPYVLDMNGDKAVSATYAQDQYTLTVISAHGPVSKEPDQATYTYGTEVVLTMGTVDAGWTFTGWSGGGCTGTAPCTVTMNANTTVTANFTPICYALTLVTTATVLTQLPARRTRQTATAGKYVAGESHPVE